MLYTGMMIRLPSLHAVSSELRVKMLYFFPSLFIILFFSFLLIYLWFEDWGFGVGVLDWVFGVGVSVDGVCCLWCGAFLVFLRLGPHYINIEG